MRNKVPSSRSIISSLASPVTQPAMTLSASIPGRKVCAKVIWLSMTDTLRRTTIMTMTTTGPSR